MELEDYVQKETELVDEEDYFFLAWVNQINEIVGL